MEGRWRVARFAIVAAQQNFKSFVFLLFKSPIRRMRKDAQLVEVRSPAVSHAAYNKRACTPPHDSELPFGMVVGRPKGSNCICWMLRSR